MEKMREKSTNNYTPVPQTGTSVNIIVINWIHSYSCKKKYPIQPASCSSKMKMEMNMKMKKTKLSPLRHTHPLPFFPKTTKQKASQQPSTYVASESLGACRKLAFRVLAGRVRSRLVRVESDLGVDLEALEDLVNAAHLTRGRGVGGIRQGSEILDGVGKAASRRSLVVGRTMLMVGTEQRLTRVVVRHLGR